LKDDASLSSLFNQFVCTLAQHILAKIDHLDPHIVSAFLEMVATTLSVNASVLLQQQQQDPIALVRLLFQLSVRHLVQQNTATKAIGAPVSETLRSALLFLESFLFGPHTQQSADWHQFVISSLDSCGADLSRGLLRAATIPGVHKQVSQLLFELLKSFREPMRALLAPVIQNDVDTLPADLFPPQTRQAVFEAFFSLQNQRRFTAFIKDLAEVCNLRAEKDVLLAYLM
jgi:hypothetical protein